MTTPIGLPYAHLNLTRNPFGELTDEDLLRVTLVDVEPWLSWLSSPNSIIQFWGDQGRGKTTSLKCLAVAAGSCKYQYVAEGVTRLGHLGQPTVVDEVQRLSASARAALFRNFNTRAIGTHEDFSTELRKAERMTLAIRLPLRWSEERLCELVDHRIEKFRRGEGPVPWLDPADAKGLVNRSGSNIRQSLAELYLALQSMKSVGPIPLSSLNPPT